MRSLIGSKAMHNADIRSYPILSVGQWAKGALATAIGGLRTLLASRCAGPYGLELKLFRSLQKRSNVRLPLYPNGPTMPLRRAIWPPCREDPCQARTSTVDLQPFSPQMSSDIAG